MDTNGKKEFIKKYKTRFSLIPLKTEPGKQKQPAINGWQQYSHKPSDFSTECLMEGNVGNVTGPQGGVFAVDVDHPDLFECFKRRYGYSLTSSYVVKTGKGYHFYFKYPDGSNNYGCKSLPLYGFDLRGVGGYVVAPYSIHEETGAYYEIISEGEISDAPEWVLEVCLSNKKAGAPNLNRIKNKKIFELIHSDLPVGERSEANMRVLDSLVAHGFNDDEIFYVFNIKPIGAKYLEKPENLRDEWLQDQIDKAREYVSDQVNAHGTEQNDDEPEITCISASE